MANQDTTPPAQPVGAATPEAFVADRQRMWSGFTQMVVWGIVALVLLLIGMAIFLV